MGTGSNRRRNTSRNRFESYRAGLPAGDWTQYNAPDYNPGYLEAGPQNQGLGGVMTGAPGTVRVTTPEAPTFVDQPGAPTYGANDMLTMDRERRKASLDNSAYARFLQGLKGKDAPTTEDPLSAWFNANYADPSADIRGAYGQQEAAINAQYDQMLARIGKEHGAAEAGVRAEGADLQGQLAAIGADAQTQMAKSNAGIDADYARALKDVNAAYKPLAADSKRGGGSTAGLQAERAAGTANLHEAQAADSALGQRYTQMLDQAINNRKATGATVTVAGVNDLARVLQESRDNTSADRLKAVASIEANMAGDLAQAKSAKSAAKYSLFLSTLKSGGSLGQAAIKIATPSVLNAARKAAQDGRPNWQTPFKNVLKSKDPDEVGMANQYLQRIASGKQSADQAWAEFQANPDRVNFPTLENALANAVAYGSTFNGLDAATAAVLKATGNTLNTGQ